MASDPCSYIRDRYGLAWLRLGVVVSVDGKLGTVTGADSHIHVRTHGGRHPVPWHPRDVELAEDQSPGPKHRHSEPERVTEHTRVSDRAVTCCACRGRISPGERYRQSIGVQTEWAESAWHLARAHAECVAHLPEWEVRDGG